MRHFIRLEILAMARGFAPEKGKAYNKPVALTLEILDEGILRVVNVEEIEEEGKKVIEE